MSGGVNLKVEISDLRISTDAYGIRIAYAVLSSGNHIKGTSR
jgi:hypothetical protein